MEVAVIGSNGFLGRELCRVLSKSYHVTEINRDNIEECFRLKHPFDYVINANGNSKKFWANNNPLEDFELSTRSVYESVLKLRYKRYIYMSSVDAGCDNFYGLNKRLAEEIIKFCTKEYIILRCSVILGKEMKKGVVKDILDNSDIYVTPDSRLQFITNTELANILVRIIDRGIYGVEISACGTGSVSVPEIATILGKPIKYSDKLTKQCFEDNTDNLLILYPELRSSKDYIMEVLQ